MEIDRIKELVDILNKAGRAYYQESREIMSNFEYDALYDELVALEEKTGVILANSPTINVGYEVLSELPKETHPSPMLSLNKTKSVDELASFLGKQEGILSWKLDGLTIVLTYEEGKIFKAVTRGNGEVGEVITPNAKAFKNIPLSIPYKKRLVIRGEAVIKYSDFEKINAEISDADAKYKNPRNLCSGSVRQLDSKITAKRNVNFFAFSLVEAEEVDFKNSRDEQLKFLENLGFEAVERVKVTAENIAESVKAFAGKIESNDFPSDGLVLLLDDIEYGRSLGTTAKFPRDSIAFKWKDETAVTKLLEVEWSPSRTGLINPVAIFEPVELEGTSVSRASLHNLSIIEGLKLGIGDEIEVYKANMIIPQVLKNHSNSDNLEPAKNCPACGEKTVIKSENGVKTLHCDNPRCPAKHVKSFSHFVSRNAMNIDGLSEETLEKFIDEGFIKEFPDIYKLENFEEDIVGKKGFGQKSYDNLIAAIEKSKVVMLPNFIYSLGILNIGLSNAKMICKYFNDDLDAMRKADRGSLASIDGVGDVIADTFVSYFEDADNNRIVDELVSLLNIKKNDYSSAGGSLEGKVFVITGSLNTFTNRDEAKAKIEEAGGKVTGSVTGKTDYLVNNDITSTSGKNKKAKELGVPIISEDELLNMLNG